jgi:type IX secretion system PorP/SprF family membrane protein
MRSKKLNNLTIILINKRYTYVLKRGYIITTMILSLVSMKSQAQYDVSFSHYFDMEPSFNAAAVGKSPKLNIAAAYAMQMAGFKRNPNTMYAGADAQFLLMKQFHGAGVQFMNDQIGLFSHKRLALQYAFKCKLFGGQLSTGISAGLLSESFDGTKVDLEESNDPAFSSSKVDGNSVDLAAGLYYSHRNWYVGVSAQHLNSPCVKLGETNELQVDATYYLTGGATIRLRNPFLTILPSFLVRSDLSGYRGDITGRLVYTNEKKMMYAGVSYAPTISTTVLIGGKFHGIVLGYSYEIYTSAINPGNGSHEIFIGYQMDLNLQKKGRNMHKSVRVL